MESTSAQLDRRSRPLAIIAWILLIGVVLVIALLQFAEPIMSQQARARSTHVDMELLIASRVAVGFDHLGEQWQAAQVEQDWSGQLQELVDAQPPERQPLETLRLTIVQAELEGPEAALQMLDQVHQRLGEQATSRQPKPSDRPSYPHDPAAHYHEAANVEALHRDVAILQQLYQSPDDPLPDHARQRLIDRHGWFGKLALSLNQPADAPVRQEAIGAATRAALTSSGSVLLVGLALLVGVVLLIVGIVLKATGILSFRYEPRLPWSVPFLETVTLFLLMMLGLSLVIGVLIGLFGWNLALAVPLLVPLALLWPRLRGMDWRRWREGLGWHRGRGMLTEAGLGLVGYLAGLPILAAGFGLSALMGQFLEQEMSHPIVEEVISGGFWQLVGVFALAVLWAPLVEESIFRGAFYTYLRHRWGITFSAVVVGLVFAVIHPQGLVGIPIIGSLGVVLALIREWRGSLIAPIFAHGVHNLAATTILLMLVG